MNPLTIVLLLSFLLIATGIQARTIQCQTWCADNACYTYCN